MSERAFETVIVTGGAGFIGANLVHMLVGQGVRVINVDKLTYAGNRESVLELEGRPGYRFVQADISDAEKMSALLVDTGPDAVIHLAAESHVDRSIAGPEVFVETNVRGTFVLLEQTRRYLEGLLPVRREAFRFLAVSTDEVYGSLGTAGAFTEQTAYDPSSPYAATKAGADHLVRAYHRTYGLPTLVTNCSNNYGPYQFPEKLIPLMIARALAHEPLPVYGRGENVRDWLYVGDHCRALWRVLCRGEVGRTYNIGGGAERRNLDLVHELCDQLQELVPPEGLGHYRELVTFVKDRPGHDFRYAIDASRIRHELDWSPAVDFASGLRQTIQWYLDHREWMQRVQSGEYRKWIDTNYTRRS